MQIEFHPEATAEFEASADWYAERSPSAARDFVSRSTSAWSELLRIRIDLL